CSGWLPSGESPSMVVTDLPSTSETGIAQERTASPLICTVQAPQDAMPQPNLVPVIFRCSRRTHRSGVLPSTPTSLRCPLTVNATIWRLLGLRLLLARVNHSPKKGARPQLCGPSWPESQERTSS